MAKARKQLDKLTKLADALAHAAGQVYDHDDVFTSDLNRQQAEQRRERDQALGEALAAYRNRRAKDFGLSKDYHRAGDEE